MHNTQISSRSVALAATEAGPPAEIHLLPAAGEFTLEDGRGPFVVRDLHEIAAASMPAGSLDLPVDFDHAGHRGAPRGEPAPAAGWIDKLAVKGDGLWGRVQWTPPGAQALADRTWRFISPTFLHDRVPPMKVQKVLGAALTNVPAFGPLLTAAASKETQVDLAKRMRQLLELAADADEGAILAAATERLGAAPDPARYVPIGALVQATAELARVNRGVSIATATNKVDAAIGAGRLPPFLRDWAVALATHNLPALEDFVAKTSGGLARLFTDIVPGHSPDGAPGGLSEDEAAVAGRLGLSAEQFKKGVRA